MRLFVSTTAGYTAVVLLLSGVISVYGRGAESVCTTVPRASSDDPDSDILVTYNTAQQRCVTDLLNKHRHGVYNRTFDCVVKCSPEQGAPFCAVGPFGKCDDRETDPEREAFFYNIQTQRCEPYQVCNEPSRDKEVNFFWLEEYCQLSCGGFSATNVNGTTISPQGKP
ncbi:hypothetical protein V5799_013151 [Amblyomma americanum]|uniref:Serine proteinase inhibitor n=1 Tax=Amblyomma americanum TaxID=6943 RepID=A0AAQ4E6S1_AMBAM